MSNNPFKFLDSFTKEDRNIFFGREHETEELYQKVFESKILLVYGVTGTGKTSLINCGLANKFNESDWLPIYVRRNQDIAQSIINELSKYSYDKKKNKTDIKSILKLLQSVYLDNFKPIYLLFDQFEELFIFGNKDERKAFVELIEAINQSDIQCKCLFVLREEYLANITEFERIIPEFFQNRIRIEKMSPTKALKTITGPCKAVGINIEDEAAENILNKVSKDKSNIELTYLQVLLDKVYQTAKEDSKGEIEITQNVVNRIGDVEDILGDFLEQQIQTFENSDDILSILKSFVSVQGTKKQVDIDEITDYLKSFGNEIKNDELSIILQKLVAKRILKEKDDQAKYELVHDALAAKIFEKFTMVEKELLDVKKYVENALYNFESRGIYLNKQDFEYLDAYKNKLILPKDLNDFVNQCRFKLDKQKKSFIRITRISAIILILMVATLGSNVIRKLKKSENKSKLATILLQKSVDPIKSINNAFAFLEEDTTSNLLNFIILNGFKNVLQSEYDTISPLYNMQKSLEFPIMNSPILEAKISKDSKYIYGWMENQNAFVLDLITNEIRGINLKGHVIETEYSERDTSIAFIFKDNRGEVYDINGILKYSFKTSLNELMNERLIRFFPSGDYHSVVANNRIAYVYDNTGNVLFELKGHTDRINSVDISPDARFIATASNDKKVLLWNYNFDTEQISVYDTLIGHYDNVWSCEFNKTGKYILTSSADSMIKIWNLKGKQINPEFTFARNLNWSERYKFNNREPDEDVYNPEVSAYYRKMCNASFSNDEREIIATGYQLDSNRTKKYFYNQVLFYDESSSFRNRGNWDYLEYSNSTLPNLENYIQLVVSPKCNLALAITKPNEIKVIAAGGIQIFSLPGTNPFFDSKGNRFFWIEGNVIHSMPATTESIKRKLKKFNLYGKPDMELQNIEII